MKTLFIRSFFILMIGMSLLSLCSFSVSSTHISERTQEHINPIEKNKKKKASEKRPRKVKQPASATAWSKAYIIIVGIAAIITAIAVLGGKIRIFAFILNSILMLISILLLLILKDDGNFYLFIIIGMVILTASFLLSLIMVLL